MDLGDPMPSGAVSERSLRERLRVFKAAADLAMSSFGRSQELYERFYGGTPSRYGPNSNSTSLIGTDRCGWWTNGWPP